MTGNDTHLVERSEPLWSTIWRAPFRADTWRRTLYALIALPATFAVLGLAIIGRSVDAVRMQRRLAASLLDERTAGAGRAWPRAGRVIVRALASAPIALVGLIVTGYLWLVVFLNIFFPLRAALGDLQLDQSWGGPSLLGAWAVHGAGGVAFLFLTPWVVRGLTWLHARVAG